MQQAERISSQVMESLSTPERVETHLGALEFPLGMPSDETAELVYSAWRWSPLSWCTGSAAGSARAFARGSFFPSLLERRRRIDQALYAVIPGAAPGRKRRHGSSALKP
ncbi:hypothetical protein O3S80_11885 [Streptomyces sp. Lzd4kr]|nr:hypothetical protein [Streptomyces sp. Lzd4kr]